MYAHACTYKDVMKTDNSGAAGGEQSKPSTCIYNALSGRYLRDRFYNGYYYCEFCDLRRNRNS